MFKMLLALILLNLGSLWAAPELLIKNPKFYLFDQKSFENHFNEAYQLFAHEISELDGKIVVSISPESCLRTAYSRENHEVEFCPTNKVINAGLNSSDVIHHELFHAFLCQYDESLCEMKEKDYLHEALADVFAWYLEPDDVFGEDFYKNQLYLRKYRTTFRVGLVQGDHSIGNALCSQFIAERTPLKKLISLFHEPDPKEEVTDVVIGAPYSRLNRYRLPLNQSMQMAFTFSPEAEVTALEWNVPQGIKVEKISDFEFTISITSEPETSKGFVVFLSKDGQEVGRRAYYFGLKPKI